MVDNGSGTSGTKPARIRGSLSSSPLARPKSLIHLLAGRIQDYIYFPTPDPLYVVLGTVAANMMMGMPVWVMLVGSSSSGKTLLLEMLGGLCPDEKLAVKDAEKRVHIVGAIKSPSALLSGVAKKDQGKGATGGLLRQVGARGMIVMTDFTGMLTLPREPLHEMIGALRYVFDGRYSRPLGTEGGRVLEWKGRVGFLGASTPAIDRHSGLIGEMGERWVYYRFPETDGYGETVRMLKVRNPQSMMEELRELVVQFFDTLELSWLADEETRALERTEIDRLYAMAAFSVAARSGVPRDAYQQSEIVDIASREGVPRLAGELGQLYLGMERIGIEADERWRIIGKVAVDSVRQLRMAVINIMRTAKAGMPVKVTLVRDMLQCGRKTAEITVEDLLVHGMVEKTGRTVDRTGGDGGSGGYRMSAWARKQWELGWEGQGSVETNDSGGE